VLGFVHFSGLFDQLSVHTWSKNPVLTDGTACLLFRDQNIAGSMGGIYTVHTVCNVTRKVLQQCRTQTMASLCDVISAHGSIGSKEQATRDELLC